MGLKKQTLLASLRFAGLVAGRWIKKSDDNNLTRSENDEKNYLNSFVHFNDVGTF